MSNPPSRIAAESLASHGAMWLAAWLFAAAAGPAAGASAQPAIEQELARSPIRGGLCVLVGPVDAALAAGIARRGPFAVHCLMTDAKQVAAARTALLDERLYGQASVEAWRGPALPYADNLVSLLVVLEGGAAGPAEQELLRVLRPGGQLLIRRGEGFTSTLKPRPAGMDDWTHWRHGADRNAVSADKLAEVPQRIQWLFSRSIVTERSHAVLAGGRYFAQDRHMLIARDAFNGLPLWTAPLKKGEDFAWEWTVKVAALIVAAGDRVYALAEDGLLKALDAATGRPVMGYAEAGRPYDILLADDGKSKLGTLVLAGKDSIRSLDAETGRLLWKHEADYPHNVIACPYAAFYIEGNDRRGAIEGEISARDLRTGRLLWKKGYDWARRTELGAFGSDRIVYEIRAPASWRELYEAYPEQKEKDRYALAVISARTGEELQRIRGTGTSARHGEFRRAFWYKGRLLTEAQGREGLMLVLFGPDDFSRPAESFRANYVGDRGFGHCYPPVLTDRFYLNGQLNFTDLQTHEQVSNQITRGACNTSRAGYLPANGMIYTFPKHCLCFPMLEGNVCLAPAYKPPPDENTELAKGPAFDAFASRRVEPGDGRTQTAGRDDWPTFRHDAWRSGGTDSAVPAGLQMLWTAEVPGPDYKALPAAEWRDNPFVAGPLSAPVIAGGLVYVAQADTHSLAALDAATGQVRWRFTADGRIDGPPTIHGGMCLLGCRDGWVYNLRAEDGELIWKRRLAPCERRISVYGQLESPWPVAGSVLVTDRLAYAAAGIHPNADGGVRVFCLRPETGEVVWDRRFDDLGFASHWPDPYEPRKTRPDSDPWRTIQPREYRPHDLPVRDGNSVAISRCLFDLKTGQVSLRKTSGFYRLGGGAYLPRTAWHYGDARIFSPPAVARGSAVFSTVPGISRLFRADFPPTSSFNTDWVHITREDEKAGFASSTSKLYRMGGGPRWAVESADGERRPNRAMLIAGDLLFTATPRGLLTIHAAADGRKVGELELEPAAWDGLAAAGGRLFLTTESGKLLCLGNR